MIVAAAARLHKHARHVHASRAHSYAVLGRALLRRLEGFEQVHHIAHFPKVIGPIASHEDYEIAPWSPASGPLGRLQVSLLGLDLLLLLDYEPGFLDCF